MERETGFEPATSTLARSHSTTELFPPERPKYHTAGPVSTESPPPRAVAECPPTKEPNDAFDHRDPRDRSRDPRRATARRSRREHRHRLSRAEHRHDQRTAGEGLHCAHRWSRRLVGSGAHLLA